MCNHVVMDDIDDGREGAFRVDRAHTAAHLYYVQNRTMDAIARELRTSRSTVSRLLSYARAQGIVDIRIRSPHEAPHTLESRIATRLGVTAHVVPMPGDLPEAERLARVALGAAHVIHDFVHSELTVGVAWGSTLAAVSTHLIPKPVHDTTFVQLNGSGNTNTTGLLYASEILSRFGEAYRGSVQQFPVPAFFDDPETKRLLWRERSKPLTRCGSRSKRFSTCGAAKSLMCPRRRTRWASCSSAWGPRRRGYAATYTPADSSTRPISAPSPGTVWSATSPRSSSAPTGPATASP